MKLFIFFANQVISLITSKNKISLNYLKNT